jgi:hypothetical protein
VPDHIWYVYTDYLAEQARLAKVSAANSEAAAMSSVDSAAASALIASNKAASATDSATNALLSAQEADISEANALASANAANTAKENAAASQASAAGHASVASGARDEAVAAKDTAVAVELAQVINGSIDANGHLILTKYDGTTIDAGRVVSGLTVGTVTTGP